jgi:tetratricopeptide (TPR) repeat protein
MSGTFGTRLLERAERQMHAGQYQEAIDNLAGYLGQAPQDGDAHALLAICLCHRHRLATALLEAEAALSIDPRAPFAQMANGIVRQARREPKRAEEHFRSALELLPEWDWPPRELARLCLYWGRREEAREWLGRARALAPDEAENRVLEARWHFQYGEARTAEAIALDVLSANPAYVDALCVLGFAQLKQGRTQEALAHAIWAVRNAPTERAPLALLVATKMRSNPLTGLWWRFNSFFSSGSATRSVSLMLGVYLGIRVSTLVLQDFGMPAAADMLTYLWLGFCAYSWVAPALFQRALAKELERVKLNADF